ncbi:MAG: hypothetical protein KF893_26740 [Caldilineaceae bacterium]|nr:hypothetical protein [Caldilineaceae bacterium]
MKKNAAVQHLYRFLLLFLILWLLNSPTPAQAEMDTPTDTPTPVVSDTVEEWSLHSGLLYWANTCFAEELPPPSTLKRQPVAGGILRTLETTTAESCLTYLNLAAADDGVYY